MKGNQSLKCFCLCILSAMVLIGMIGFTGLKAQVTTATILGTVTDSSGAAVAGAMVTVKNTDTAVTNTAVTDSQGRYTVPALIIGTYEVDVEAAGFKRIAHGGITLTVGSETVVDATMEVGNLQQTVTVEADVSHVETTSSTVSTLVGQKQMVDLPLNGRNYQQLVALAPGVLPVAAGQGGNQAKYAIGGSRLAGQAYLLDGSDTINYWGNATGSGALGTALGIDSIAEFNLLMNNYSAQYGGAGAVMNATTKSGTNNFHGTMYEFIRNSAIEASNNYIPSLFPLSPTVLDRNQFGVSLGGPIKKDKAFFFVNYEGYRQHTSSEVLVTAPDLAARGCQGLTVQACQADGGVGPNVPTIGGKAIAYPACNAAAAYPGANPCTAQLNIQSILSLLPIGTFSDNPASGIADTFGEYTQKGTENYGMARFDYTISDKDSLFIRYVTDTAKLVTPGIVPVNPATQWTASTYATIQERRIFSPTLLNTIAVSFNRPLNIYHQFGSPTVTQIGTTSLPKYADCQGCPANQPMMYFPADGFLRETGAITGIVGTAPSGFGAAPATSTGLVGSGGVTPFDEVPNHFTFSDDVVWTRGAHNFHIGFSLERLRDNTFEPLTPSGSWGPTGGASGTSGSLAGFISGQFASANGILPNSLLYAAGLPTADSTNDSREWIYAPYIQDDLKVTNRLTVNLGLRYSPTNDVKMVRHAQGNILAAPFPNLYGSTVAATNSGGTSPTNGPYPAGTNCLNPAGQAAGTGGAFLGCGWVVVNQVTAKNVSLKNIDPRIGVAWDPFNDHKTAIRAGFGFFHTVLTARDFDYWDNPPERIAATSSLSAITNGVTTAGSQYGYPFIFASPISGNCSATSPIPYTNCATAGPGNYYGQTKTPYTMQWTASVQREVLPQTIVSLNYVGGRGVDLEGSYNFNSATACGGTDPTTGQMIFTPAPGAAGLPYLGSGGAAFAANKWVGCPLLNPTYGTFSYTNAMYDSWYEAGTINVNRTLSHGFQTQFGYTWSKSIDDASATYGGEVSIGGTGETGGLDPYNLQLTKGISTWNRKNNLRVSLIYQLPFKNNLLVSGWEVTGIYTYLSGDPFAVTGLAQGTTGGSYPNYVGGCNPYTGVTPQQAVNVNLSNGLVTNPYVNANCFSLQPVGEYGNLGRNVLIGPSNWGLDMSVIKDTNVTKVSENAVVEFRAEFFNVLNHPYWSVPTNNTLWTYNSTGGINTAGVEEANSAQPTFGGFGNPASTPRQIQFGLRLKF